ncbi:response regulator [Leptolyngbya ohadii]|uniref:response regulator n=1 Tax=Leptolyngbya ohadii TaxID=1962290 RepID=UPI0015C64FCD|nr:response regulator [Leptolyngbya ohadii]
MRSKVLPFPDYQQRFAATKIVRLFKTLRRLEFSGRVVWRTDGEPQAAGQTGDGRRWIVFLERGNLCYGTGGSHPLRRWQRHLLACCPQLSDRSINSLCQTDARIDSRIDSQIDSQHRGSGGADRREVLADCWEYRQLNQLREQGQITEQQHRRIIEQILIELLFDVSQAVEVSYQLQRYSLRPDETAVNGIGKLAEETIFATVETQWQQWFEAQLSPYSPNLAPIVRQPDYLQEETSPQVFQALMTLLDGQHPLRDLAIKTQREVQPFMQVLLPYVQSGWIDLLDIHDVSLPAVPRRPRSSPNSSTEITPPLIACIDDSLMICQSMEQVIRAGGYRFVAITEASRAIATLLAKKPDIIFLDLIMPDTNGYEICSQLRKVSRFKETPIIILTGNDGIVDQVRARLMGATDFLSKPMEPAVILSTIQRFTGRKT